MCSHEIDFAVKQCWTHCNHVYQSEWINMIIDGFNRLIRIHAVMQYSQYDFLECIVIILSSGLNFGNVFKLISGFAINVWMTASGEYWNHAFNVLNVILIHYHCSVTIIIMIETNAFTRFHDGRLILLFMKCNSEQQPEDSQRNRHMNLFGSFACSCSL